MPTPVKSLTVAQAISELKRITSLPWEMHPLWGLNIIAVDSILFRQYADYTDDKSMRDMVGEKFGVRANVLIDNLLEVGSQYVYLSCGHSYEFLNSTIKELIELKNEIRCKQGPQKLKELNETQTAVDSSTVFLMEE